MEKHTLIPNREEDGQRLDVFVAARLPDLTRSAVQKLTAQGLLTVAGKPAGKNLRVQEGRPVEITVPDPVELSAEPENIPLDIVYEDKDLLVVNKPKGMVVHPAPGTPNGTLVNALLFHCKDGLSGINGVLRPGIVHRIDKDTSGL